MSVSPIISIQPLGFQWPVLDPFLFCVHHHDYFPKGNGEMGPAASLEGRNIGQDFTIKDGWRMYHGDVIPGFPAHPHRGFETVTVVLQGFVDHSDSHGQAGRYGNGDVQWMTAGSGLQHSEMFPLLYDDKENTGELFQIWINLPKAKKMVEPHFKMLWAEDIPVRKFQDVKEKTTEVTLIAGSLDGTNALDPAPDSWAADEKNEVLIWTVKMEQGAKWCIPTASKNAFRVVYFYKGDSVTVNGEEIGEYKAFQLVPDAEVELVAGETDCFFLILQGIPIDEPVFQHGPFVMNSKAEIMKAFVDFDETKFGGWPWERSDMVHPKDKGRFATHIDGTEEIRT